MLFGHEAGAFTDAKTAKAGLFGSAHGGSLFLDEIAKVPLAAQAKLLKALEDGEVMRVGATRPMQVDERVISATNRNLEEEVEASRLLADLVPRLNTEIVWLPPLRARVGDIRALAEHYAARFARQPVSLATEAIAILEPQSWPENVRGLVNIVERAVMEAGPGKPVTVEHVREALARGRRKVAAAVGGAAMACSGQEAAEPDWERISGRKCKECRRR